MQDMPIGTPRLLPEHPVARGPRHSMASLQWLEGLFHAGNGLEVRLDLYHLSMDGCRWDAGRVFQFHVCLFHGHSCYHFMDMWLSNTTQARYEWMEQDEEYLRNSCGYTVVTIWEWEHLKHADPATVVTAGRSCTLNYAQSPLPGPQLPVGVIFMWSCGQIIRPDPCGPAHAWRTEGQEWWPVTYLQVHLGDQGDYWAAHDPVLWQCWSCVSAPGGPYQ